MGDWFVIAKGDQRILIGTRVAILPAAEEEQQEEDREDNAEKSGEK